MKRIKAIVLTLTLSMGLLSGCGKNYSSEASTVFVEEKGEIVSTDVEEFDSSVYDEDSFKEYVESEIKKYTDENGKDTVSLDKIKVKDGKALLTIKYNSPADYAKFNGIELYTGTVSEALAAGYKIEGEFNSVDGGKLSPCDASSILEQKDYKVVIFKGKCNISVDGKIAYCSGNVESLFNESTAIIGEAEVATETETSQAPAENSQVLEESESSQASDDGSISEEDMLEGSTQQATTEYNFPEDKDDSASVKNDVDTIIIYK